MLYIYARDNAFYFEYQERELPSRSVTISSCSGIPSKV